jgi:outer membrane lipoprotein SlyB
MERKEGMMHSAAKNIAAAAVLTLVACGSPGPRYSGPVYESYGTVESVEAFGAPSSSGAGAVLGGIAGGVLGHQIGHGRGQDAATVAGAIGGAVVGNEVERSNNARTRYRISVRMDDGSRLAFTQDYNDLRTGDRVRVVNGQVERY